jgi:hypothetical protein
MAVLFTVLQGMEYLGVSYTITDSVFGSTFYMGTGLFLLGPMYLIISPLAYERAGSLLSCFPLRNLREKINKIYLIKTSLLVEHNKASIKV